MSSDTDETSPNRTEETAEPCELEKELEAQRKRYIQNRILQDALKELTGGDSLENDLSEKVREILIFQDVLEGVSLDEAPDTFVLGLSASDLTPPELFFQEQCKLKRILEGHLLDSYHNFKKNYPHLLEANLCTNIQDKLAKDLKEKLNLKQEKDLGALTQTSLNLDEIIRLRTEELPKMVARKIEEYELKIKISHAKYKVLLYKIKMCIFTEVDKGVEVYRELITDIEKQQDECKKNIEALKLLKEKYRTVQSKEFDSILERYLQYKSQIHEKQVLLSNLQKQ